MCPAIGYSAICSSLKRCLGPVSVCRSVLPFWGLFSFQPHPCCFNWYDSSYFCCNAFVRVSNILDCRCLTHCLRAPSLQEIGTSSKGFEQDSVWDNCMCCCARDPSFPEISLRLRNAEIQLHSPLLSLAYGPSSFCLPESSELSQMGLAMQSRLANVSAEPALHVKRVPEILLPHYAGFI